MNGYPKNHDCAHKQPEHDRIARDGAEWEKTNRIEVIPFGAASNPSSAKWDSFVIRNKVLFNDLEDE